MRSYTIGFLVGALGVEPDAKGVRLHPYKLFSSSFSTALSAVEKEDREDKRKG